MTTTHATTETQNWRQYRRLRVWEMHQQGHRQQAIADALGLTQGAVSQIIARAEAGWCRRRGAGCCARCACCIEHGQPAKHPERSRQEELDGKASTDTGLVASHDRWQARDRVVPANIVLVRVPGATYDSTGVTRR